MTEASLRAAGFRGAVRAEEPLAPYTTWRIGGPAEILATPRDQKCGCRREEEHHGE